MKKILLLLCFHLAADNLLYAQSRSLAAFNTMLRDFDLNEDMQEHYAITAEEYRTLLTAWQKLEPSDKLELRGFERYYWEDTFAEMLLCDFAVGATWEEHVAKMTKLGARDMSLTLSRHQAPITVANARGNLADLLHKGPSMFEGERFLIPEEIKLAAQTRVGEAARARLQTWEDLINRLRHASAREQAETVNKFFNQNLTAHLEARATQGYDYWQSPIETLVAGGGDCDDYAIAKYVSLRMLGIPAEQLRMSVVALPDAGYHAVLLFFFNPKQNPWVLDNLGSLRLGTSADAVSDLQERMNFDGMKLLWGMNEKTLSRFHANAREKKISSFPYQKFLAAATTFANSFRLLPPRAWGQCERSAGKGCICYRLGILAGTIKE